MTTGSGATSASKSPSGSRLQAWKNRFTPSPGWRQRWPRRGANRTGNTGIMKPASASALATFFLVWVGTSVTTLANPLVSGGGSYGNLAIALSFGIALTAGLLIGGPNAQANTAETVATSLRTKDRPGLKLVLPQLAGAIAASVLVRLSYGSHGLDDAKLGAAVPTVANGLTTGVVAIFLAEFTGTFLLARSSRNASLLGFGSTAAKAVISGATLAACLFATLTISGGALNPARLLGPVIVLMLTGGSLDRALAGTVLNGLGYLLLYLVAQFAGAYLGVGRPVGTVRPPVVSPAQPAP